MPATAISTSPDGSSRRRNNMARKLEWINPNKARIDTGHKDLDQQCETVSQGQVIGTCQLVYCIWPVDEVECNGHTFPKGHLRQADLNWFDSVPYRVRNFIDKIEHPVILYEFRHWGRRLAHDHEQHKKIVDGY